MAGFFLLASPLPQILLLAIRNSNFRYPKHALPIWHVRAVHDLCDPPVLLAPPEVQPVGALVRKDVASDRNRGIAEQYVRPIHHLVGYIDRKVVDVRKLLERVQMLV